MKIFMFFSFLFICGSVSARVDIPLIGSSESVINSKFCKKYQCQELSSAIFVNPYTKTANEKIYRYKLAVGLDMMVIRFTPTMEITQAQLSLSGKFGKTERSAYNYINLVTSFINEFTGDYTYTTFGAFCKTLDALRENPDYKVLTDIQTYGNYRLSARCDPNNKGISNYSVNITKIEY